MINRLLTILAFLAAVSVTASVVGCSNKTTDTPPSMQQSTQGATSSAPVQPAANAGAGADVPRPAPSPSIAPVTTQ